jgi:transposase InsO family protein
MAHRNARLTPFGRGLLVDRVEQGWTITAAARAAGISRQTASKWLRRARLEGAAGLADRRCRPRRISYRLSGRELRPVVLLRLRRRMGPAPIAWRLGLAGSTVYRTLRRLGLARLRDLRPQEPVVRYCWPAAGELVHLDTKRLARIAAGGGWRFVGRGVVDRHHGIGWNYVHVAVDDATRLAYAEELADERGPTAAGFLERALAFFAAHGVGVERLLTDNGTCYRSHAFRDRAQEHGLRHLRTRPYRPQTNGKAEAFVKLLQNGWAYRRPYDSGEERREALGAFLTYYNAYRPHGGLGGDTPMARLSAVNKVVVQNS